MARPMTAAASGGEDFSSARIASQVASLQMRIGILEGGQQIVVRQRA